VTVTDASSLEQRLIGWLAARLQMRPGALDRRRAFSDLGLTSLMAVELAQALGEWTGRTVLPTITWSFSTVESLARHLFAGDIRQLSEEDAEAMLIEELELLKG
jgi:acyl carrier protein